MSVLTSNRLVFQQTTQFFRSDFAIYDADSSLQVAHVETGGAKIVRLATGARQLYVYDGPETPLIHVSMPINMALSRDRAYVYEPDGSPLVEVVKHLGFGKRQVSIDIRGEAVDLVGTYWGFNFQLVGPYGVMATATRKWQGVSNSLFGKSTYLLTLADNLDPVRRRAVIGTVLAISLLLNKRDNGS